MSFFQTMQDFFGAGLTPNDRGEFKVGQSEMARLDAYRQQKIEDERFFSKTNFDFDNWMNDE